VLGRPGVHQDANFDPDAPETGHDRFWFGLGCLLDGFAAAIAAA
jgi:hypothetical protein